MYKYLECWKLPRPTETSKKLKILKAYLFTCLTSWRQWGQEIKKVCRVLNHPVTFSKKARKLEKLKSTRTWWSTISFKKITAIFTQSHFFFLLIRSLLCLKRIRPLRDYERDCYPNIRRLHHATVVHHLTTQRGGESPWNFFLLSWSTEQLKKDVQVTSQRTRK